LKSNVEKVEVSMLTSDHDASLNGSHHASLPLSKVERDVESLKKFARFIILIESDGSIRVISNYHLLVTNQLVIPLIAVVTQIQSFDCPVWASVLEIGYKRARPYRRVENTNTGELLLQNRDDSHHLTETQFLAVYPTLLKCLEAVLVETRVKWKSDDVRFINGRAYERGVQITVRHSDAMLCHALLRESLKYFRIAHGNKLIRWLNYTLRHNKFNRYSVGQYGPNVRIAAASVMRSRFSKRPFWTEGLLLNVHKRSLLENALLDIHGFFSEWDDEARLAFEIARLPLPNADGLLIWHTLDQPSDKQSGTHAHGCSRFEVIFDRRSVKHRGKREGEFFQPVLPEEYQDDPVYSPF
jgi:hypothetical protein